MNKLIVIGSVAAFTIYSVGYIYLHTGIREPHEDEYREVYTRLNPEIQLMATGSMGYDKPAKDTYHLS